MLFFLRFFIIYSLCKNCHGEVLFNFCFLYNRHAGDIGNIEADSQGKAEVNITDNIVSLTGEHSVIGRTVEVSILLLKFIVSVSSLYCKVDCSWSGKNEGGVRGIRKLQNCVKKCKNPCNTLSKSTKKPKPLSHKYARCCLSSIIHTSYRLSQGNHKTHTRVTIV